MQISAHPFPIYGALKRIFGGRRSAREWNPRICLDLYHARMRTKGEAFKGDSSPLCQGTHYAKVYTFFNVVSFLILSLNVNLAPKYGRNT